MTKATLTRRLKYWQQQLDHLGLPNWKIEDVTINDAPDGSEGTDACAHVSRFYNSVWFEFRKEFLDEAEPFDVDRIIIHEWLHAAFRAHNTAVYHPPEEHMSPAVYALWREQVNAAEENLIESLARQLAHALSPYVVP